MTLVEEVAERQLTWRQAEALRRYFQLMDGEREIASVRFESLGGSRATGQSGGKAWTFKRTGFLSPKITIREPGSDKDIAAFSPGWMGSGWIAFAGGRRFQLRHTNFWGTAWAFEAEDGAPAVLLSAHPGFFKQGGVATVTQAAAGWPETPVLLLLIWYVRILANEDAAASAGVAGS
ncbi:MAG: hypothetical protein ABSH50_23455 [Bryobacteraceae bacterium]|jgi:hypothetical protein